MQWARFMKLGNVVKRREGNSVTSKPKSFNLFGERESVGNQLRLIGRAWCSRGCDITR